MHYRVVVFGVKDTSENIIDFIQEKICPVDLVITISPEVTKRNDVSGYKGLKYLEEKYSLKVYEAASYSLDDGETKDFITNNTFDIGISMGWQRLIPGYVLDAFRFGVFGFHGNAGYLPFGRGRSPLNWSMLLGDTRFNLNLFKYDEKADSPNIFATEMFQISPFDDIRTAQYKNMIVSKRLIKKLLEAYSDGNISIRTESKDYDSWFGKRTAADGLIDFKARTRQIYDLIRAVAPPFPGAFAYIGGQKIMIYSAQPFDEMIDFSGYEPGEIVDIFDGRLVVRCVDGSLLINKYDYDGEIRVGDILKEV